MVESSINKILNKKKREGKAYYGRPYQQNYNSELLDREHALDFRLQNFSATTSSTIYRFPSSLLITNTLIVKKNSTYFHFLF